MDPVDPDSDLDPQRCFSYVLSSCTYVSSQEASFGCAVPCTRETSVQICMSARVVNRTLGYRLVFGSRFSWVWGSDPYQDLKMNDKKPHFYEVVVLFEGLEVSPGVWNFFMEDSL